MQQVAGQALSVGFSFISLLELQLPTRGDWTESYQFQLLRYLPMYGCEPSVLELAEHFENELALRCIRYRRDGGSSVLGPRSAVTRVTGDEVLRELVDGGGGGFFAAENERGEVDGDTDKAVILEGITAHGKASTINIRVIRAEVNRLEFDEEHVLRQIQFDIMDGGFGG